MTPSGRPTYLLSASIDALAHTKHAQPICESLPCCRATLGSQKPSDIDRDCFKTHIVNQCDILGGALSCRPSYTHTRSKTSQQCSPFNQNPPEPNQNSYPRFLFHRRSRRVEALSRVDTLQRGMEWIRHACPCSSACPSVQALCCLPWCLPSAQWGDRKFNWGGGGGGGMEPPQLNFRRAMPPRCMGVLREGRTPQDE